MWLQNEYNFDMNSVTDSSGNNFLHQIAKSENAARFIEKLVSRSGNPHFDVAHAHIESDKLMTEGVNFDGQTWLEILVNKRDLRALDVALSPRHELSWSLQNVDIEKFQKLQDCVFQHEDERLKLIVDSFSDRCRMNEQYYTICSNGWESEDDIFALESTRCFGWSDAALYAGDFVRFLHDWKDRVPYPTVVTKVLQRGATRLFELFYSANKGLFWNAMDLVFLNDDNNEYIQPEISSDFDREAVASDFITICVVGQPLHPYSDIHLSTKRRYFRCVK